MRLQVPLVKKSDNLTLPAPMALKLDMEAVALTTIGFEVIGSKFKVTVTLNVKSLSER